MDAARLMFIKRVQREYIEKFGDKLEIDWSLMNKEDSPTKQYNDKVALSKLEELCKENGTTISNIRNNRIYFTMFPKESKVLIDWCHWIRKNNYREHMACKLINKDRKLIYYYANKKSK